MRLEQLKKCHTILGSLKKATIGRRFVYGGWFGVVMVLFVGLGRVGRLVAWSWHPFVMSSLK